MRKKVLITGAHGFIGKHLINFLTVNKISYSILERKTFDNENELKNKILDSDAIIHLAALIRGTFDELHDANFGNTEKILKILSRISGKKPIFVYPSSFAVYGEQNKLLTEDSVLNPRNDYGKSKLEVENLIRSYSSKFEIPSIILRISNVYGLGASPYTHSVIATFVDQVRSNKSITINGDGTQLRDFVYIDDAIKALWLAANKKVKDAGKVIIVNVCTGIPRSLNQLVDDICVIIGAKPKVEYVNKYGKEKGYWVGDNGLALRILNWKPEITLLEGLRKSYAQ